MRIRIALIILTRTHLKVYRFTVPYRGMGVVIQRTKKYIISKRRDILYDTFTRFRVSIALMNNGYVSLEVVWNDL